MKFLVDIVNFNADASCLSAQRWLEALRGGAESELCAWLGGYVETKSRVTLGFIGGTLADIAILNHEAVDLINAHPTPSRCSSAPSRTILRLCAPTPDSG